MKLRKILLIALVSVCAFSFLACKKKEEEKEVATYTYNSYSTSLANNWNPHTWETSADSAVLGYIESPFVDMSIKDSKTGEYQWVYEMATSVKDVTEAHQDDLTKYGASLPEGQEASETKSGYVFEIALNQNAKWANGEVINADTYIESMKLLLDSTMHNYRANLYIEGESAIAGAKSFYYSGCKGNGAAEKAYTAYDSSIDDKLVFKVDQSGETYFDDWLNGYIADYVPGSFADIDSLLASGFGASFGVAEFTALNGHTLAEIKADATLNEYWETIYAWWATDVNETLNFFVADYEFPVVDYDTVGVYKVDDYTIRYVCYTYIDLNYFLSSLTSNWIVYKPLYEASYDTTGELKTTKYGSSVETTMAYGPYMISSYEDGKQMVYVQNPNWYGYTKLEDGSLYSETQFEVDGKKVQQYQTTKIVIDVMDDNAAKLKFLSGELDDWTPASDELSQYTLSSQLYKVDETYMMSLFFDTNVDKLKDMDTAGTNINGVVLSNEKFRKAFSLAIDRNEWVTATAGYKPGYYLLNYLYYYDAFNDPTSLYRNSDEAKQAIVNLYGVEYGAGKAYATLDEAYNSINGYNLTEAKKLMKEACEELVAAGLYTAGEEITISFAYKKGALDSDDNKQLALFEKYINAAIEGSGFGKITIKGVGNINDRYGAVGSEGTYAVGYGAWGGAAFYPFRNFQVYMDPNNYSLNEGLCWDPTTETFTITFPNDSEVYGELAGTTATKTYQDWSNSMVGTGDYATCSFDVQLYITAQLEEAYLKKYYRIPLATSTACSMLSYKMNYYTEDYNIMYGFGGLRLIKYNYTDTEWAKYVADNNNSLNYN